MIEQLQRTAEWMAARKGRITGSSAGAALGLCPWRTPDDVIRAMVREYHGAETEFKGNPATDYGNRHERQAQQWFIRETGVDVEDCGFIPYEDWSGASPDGLTSDMATLEIKCPFGLRNDAEPAFKPLAEQPHYYAQVQLEMLCAGRAHAHFVQYRPPIGDVFSPDYIAETGVIEHIRFDDSWFDEHLPKLRAFYERYLAELDNPEHLKPLRVEIDTQRAQSMVDRIAELDDALATLADERKSLIGSLIEMAGNEDAIICGHKLTKVERKGSVQYGKIPDIQDVDLEQYRGKPSVSWRFT
jgi:putative phage-type endonuclease